MIAFGNKHLLTGLILVTALLPAVSRAFTLGSLAPGVLVVSVLNILILTLSLFGSQLMLRSAMVIALLGVLAFVLGHATISMAIHDQFDVERFVKTYLFLVIFLGGAFAFCLWVNRHSESHVNYAIHFVAYVLMISGGLALLGISPFFSSRIPVVFFNETSHYALQLSPFLLFISISSKGITRHYWWLFAVILSILLKSTTLIVIALLLFVIIAVLRKQLIIYSIFISAALLSIPESEIDYFSDRMVLSPESDNLSVLALLQGFERANLNFQETYGLGVGFQQFGVVGSVGDVILRIDSLGAENLNLFDGATVGAKLVGEFGIFGLLLVGIYLFYFVKKVHWLRQVARGNIAARKIEIFFTGCFVLFIVELFARGTAYFSSTGFMFCASLFWFARAGRLDSERKYVRTVS